MLHLKSVNLKKQKIDTLVIPVCENKEIHDDPAIKESIKKALKLKEFGGKKDEVVILYDISDINARRVMFAGLGKFEDLGRENLRAMAGKTVKHCLKDEPPDLWFAVPAGGKIDLTPVETIEPLLEGAYLGNHIFQKYKGEKKKKPLRQINFQVKGPM